MIAFSAFLILASKGGGRDHQGKNFLKIAAIINFISVTALIFVPISYNTTEMLTDEQRNAIYSMIYALPTLIAYAPRIFTFGAGTF
jgi:hypothetical protein